MVALARFDADGQWQETWVCDGLVREQLAPTGVRVGRWPVRQLCPLDLAAEGLAAVRAAYGEELAVLEQDFALRSADRVVLAPGDARWPALRQQFLAEHRHADAEIRFFLAGTGLFHLRSGEGFLGLLCEAGEWVALPAGIAHRFDAGEEPAFEVLRLFGQPDGWAAQPTGAALPSLPLHDAFVEQLLELMGEAAQE
jgi:1,2-dihydroxy-3-keto-5-methylthiopentene dioxygenase